jgi:hypothetical protein
MEPIAVIPYETGHEVIMLSGVLVEFQYSLDGKGVVTITVGDNWEANVEKLSSGELAARKQKVLRSVPEFVSGGDINCVNGCNIKLDANLKGGMPWHEAQSKWHDCIAICASGSSP